MEKLDVDIINLLDIALPEEYLDSKINDTQSLEALVILLKLKSRRILDEKSQRINYSLQQIFERENEDIYQQCKVLETIFLVIKNPEEGILQVITYLNFQLDQIITMSLNNNIVTKITLLLNELILICNVHKSGHIFQEKMSLNQVDKFLFYAIQNQTSAKTFILSTVLPNYINLLSESNQLNFLHNYFSQSKDVHNLDVLCILFNCLDNKALLINSKSILLLSDFWQYIEHCISYNVYGEQKQAIFLLKKCVQVFCDLEIVKCEIPYLQVSDVETFQEMKKVWQNVFILLDTSKEKQLHLIWPSLTLLNSLRHVNSIWQICIYKKLLTHTQNAVVYFVASHVLRNYLFFPTLNQSFLSAINKNEYMDYCTNMFKELPNFCNKLKPIDFLLFIEDILKITWVPTAAWCFFANVFTENLKKYIPFKAVEPIYKLLKQLPHVYIRNGCISIFFNYFVKHFNWKIDLDDVLKLLSMLKHHDNSLFLKAVSNYVIDLNSVNIILLRMDSNDLDINMLDVFIQIIKVLKYETGIQAITAHIEKFNKQLQVVIYANLFERFEISDIKLFILEQVTELDEDCTDRFLLIIIKKLLTIPDFDEMVNSKMLHILNNSNDFNKYAVSIALQVQIISNSYKSNKIIIKKIADDLKHRLFEYGKTDDNLFVLFLDLYFITEEYPEKLLLEHIIHNQSDVVISKMFECLSNFICHKNCINIIYFLKEVLNVLPHLTKSKHFKAIVLNYINCIYSISFLQTVCDTETIDVIRVATDFLLSLSETFPAINYYLSEKIKNSVVSSEFSRECCFILIPVIEELLLKGSVVKKDERVEYCVCQEVYEKCGNEAENPNFIKISTRMSSLESMLHIISKNPEYADDFATRLMKKYRTNFNKRYFPDSQIHLQKLRIVQTLLTIYPFIIQQRQLLIDLIEESFCTEIHQPCVKQLMQWLLLCLLKDQEDDYFNSIKIKIDTSSKTQPSTIVAFIVVLLHLTLSKEESFWFSAVEALIPWTMGANFKLRVYSQAAIKKLLEEGKRKHYEDFVAKFSYLEKSILSVIEASGNAFYETLKSDELIFSVFEHDKHYSLETIYVDIPKLNGVTRIEWENILKYKFITNTICTYNENRLFSNSVTSYIEKNNKVKTSEYLFENTHNIQRKIDPWKNVTEEQRNAEQISEFILIASLIDKSTNLGGLSRTCEVFGVKQLVLNDIKILHDKEFKSLSMSSEDWVNALEVKTSDLKKFICEIRNKGYSVIGAEQTSDSICLDKYKFNKKTALVLGNEKEGIAPDILPILDVCIEIPQFGMVRSLNVHVAGATFIWEYAKQHLIK